MMLFLPPVLMFGGVFLFIENGYKPFSGKVTRIEVFPYIGIECPEPILKLAGITYMLIGGLAVLIGFLIIILGVSRIY